MSRIPSTTVGGKRWKIKQGVNESEITKSEPHATNDDQFWLTLQSPGPFVVRSAGRARGTDVHRSDERRARAEGLSHAVHGERRACAPSGFTKRRSRRSISSRTTADWHKADASDRLITIHQTEIVRSCRPYGSDDLAGANPNVTRVDPALGTAGRRSTRLDTAAASSTRWTTSRSASRSVSITRRTGWRISIPVPAHKAAGDPTVQVHLIPSWGMSIGQGAICCPSPLGTVFNVDGVALGVGGACLRRSDLVVR